MVKTHAILNDISSLHSWMENQVIASTPPVSRVTKLKLRVTRVPKARLQKRGGARRQKERVQTYAEVDTCNL